MSENAKISELRELCEEAYLTSREDFEEVDWERVKTDDLYLNRFLVEKNDNVQDAANMLVQALKWRKLAGVNQIKATDFPQEFFDITEVHPYVNNKNDVPMVYVRIEVHRPLPDWRAVVERFLLFMIEHAEKRVTETGAKIGVVFDCRNGNVLNAELDIDLFVIKTVFNYYPQIVDHIILYELPWVLWALFKIVQSWFPPQYRNIFVFASKDQLFDLVGRENLPDYLSGTCDQSYRHYWKGNPSIEEVARNFALKDTAVQQFTSKYHKFLKN